MNSHHTGQLNSEPKKIIFIRASPVAPESRLEKEVESLVKFGYEIHVLAWNRHMSEPKYETRKGYTICRLGLKAPSGIKIVFYWPIWWLFISAKLLISDYDYIHAADFDGYFPACLIAKLRRKKIVYDIYDFYPDMIELPNIIYNVFVKLDIKLMKHADAIIIVDESRLKQIHQKSNSKIHIIYNSPDYVQYHNNNQCQNRDQFKIFYGGTIHPERDLLSMIRLCIEYPEIQLLIAGMGDNSIISHIDDLAKKHENISFIGKLPYSEIIKQSYDADILFGLYNPDNKNNKFASPNKLFEAMMCGKPIIMNSGIASADIVSKEGNGILVKYGDYESLKNAVIFLKNNADIRNDMGINGRRAYDTIYNWKLMEKRLVELYASFQERSNIDTQDLV